MLNLKARLDQIEKRTRHYKYMPVVFAHSKEELEQQRHRIGAETVVFLYDWDGAGIDVQGTVIIDNLPDE